jgi:hypothetical protein
LKLKVNTSGFFAVAEAAVGLRKDKVIAHCFNSVMEFYLLFQTLFTLKLEGRSIGDTEVRYLANALRNNRVSSHPFCFSYTIFFPTDIDYIDSPRQSNRRKWGIFSL